MKSLACLSLLIFLASACVHAADEAPAADPDLPQPLDLSFADSLTSQSPFTRSVNLEDSIQLTGIAYVDGRPVATVVNTATKERMVITEEPNAYGWHLTEAAATPDLSITEIRMMVGPEEITMHYHAIPGSGGGMEKNSTSTSRIAGNSKRPKDGGSDDKFKVSTVLGEGGKEKYASLSSQGRDKFKEIVRSHLEKRPDLTPQQSSDYAQKVFAKIKASDQGGAASTARSPKPEKPLKKKQGA